MIKKNEKDHADFVDESDAESESDHENLMTFSTTCGNATVEIAPLEIGNRIELKVFTTFILFCCENTRYLKFTVIKMCFIFFSACRIAQ